MARAGLGAAGGYAMTGDWGGAAGGAAVGAFAGGMIAKKAAKMGTKKGGGGIAGFVQKRLTGMQNFGTRGAATKEALKPLNLKKASIQPDQFKQGKMIMSNTGVNVQNARVQSAVRKQQGIMANKGVREEIGTGAQWIGNNAAEVNKWGGVALATLGAGAGAHIGSSAIRSNRGY